MNIKFVSAGGFPVTSQAADGYAVTEDENGFPVTEVPVGGFPITVLNASASANLSINYGPDAAHDGGTDGDFYVATDGDDANAGTLAAPLATLQEAFDQAVAAGGDQTILVRGGKYRQTLNIGSSPSGSNITIDRYGTENWVLTAAEVLTGWTQCTIADEPIVGANYANIYKATLTNADFAAGDLYLLNLYENDVRIDCAVDQETRNRDTAYAMRADFDFYRKTNVYDFDGSNNIISITDPAVLDKYSTANTGDIYIALHNGDNRTSITKANGFNGTTDTITLTDQTLQEHSSGVRHWYGLINSPLVIDQGRFAAIDNGDGTSTVYMWPDDTANLTDKVEFSARQSVVEYDGFQGTVTFRGGEIVQAAGASGQDGSVIRRGSNLNSPAENTGKLILEDMVLGKTSGNNSGPVHFQRMTAPELTNVKIVETGDDAIYFNYVDGARFTQMDFQKIGASPWFLTYTTDFIQSFSRAHEIARNTHTNAAYINFFSDQVLFWGNKLTNNFGYFTWGTTSRLSMGFNFIPINADPLDERAITRQNGSPSEPVANSDFYFLNNMLPPSAESQENALSLANSDNGEGHIVKNNVLEGFGYTAAIIDDRQSNYHTSLSSQDIAEPRLAGEEFQVAEFVYEDPYNGGYDLHPDAFLIDAVGADISADVAVLEALFTDFEHFDKDMDGRVYTAATPPVGPETTYETYTPAAGTVAPISFVASQDYFRLTDHSAWTETNEYSFAFDITYDATSGNTFIFAHGTTYLFVNSGGDLNFRQNYDNGSAFIALETYNTNWVSGRRYVGAVSVNQTGGKVVVYDVTNDTKTVHHNSAGTLTATDGLRPPSYLNAQADNATVANDITFNHVWYHGYAYIDAETLYDALFDASGDPTSTMTNRDAVSGVYPRFAENREANWYTHKGSRITAPDTTAPVLSSATASQDGATGATGLGVTTDEGNGTLYWGIYPDASTPSAADIVAGTGATVSGSQAVSATGVQAIADQTGLTASTAYKLHTVQDDAASNRSNVATSATFTTDAAAPAYSMNRYTTDGTCQIDYAVGQLSQSGYLNFSIWITPDTVSSGNKYLYSTSRALIRLVNDDLYWRIQDSAGTVVWEGNTLNHFAAGTEAHVAFLMDITTGTPTGEVYIDQVAPSINTTTALSQGTGLFLHNAAGDVLGGSFPYSGDFGDAFLDTTQALSLSDFHDAGSPVDLSAVGNPDVHIGGAQAASNINSSENLGNATITVTGTFTDV